MDYIKDKIRKDIADEIRYLELPSDWRPHEVIRYIVRKIEKGES